MVKNNMDVKYASEVPSTIMRAAKPQVVHFGPQGELPGGMAQVINEYLRWPFSGVELAGALTTNGRRNPRDLYQFIVCVRRMYGMRRKKAPQLAVFHLSQKGSFVREGMLAALSRMFGLATAIQLHGSEFTHHAERFPRTTSWVLQRASAVFTLTDAASAACHSLIESTTKTRVIQIANAVTAPAESDNPARSNHIVMAGELGLRKGADVAIKAWAELGSASKGWVLQLVGPRAEDIAAWPILPGLEYIGVERHQLLLDRLRNSKIALLPARHEAMPMFLLEAMAAGCAVVSTPVGQIPDVVDERTGVLVGVGDHRGLKDAIEKLINDEDLIKSLSVGAIRRIEDEYSSTVIGPRLEAEWLSIIATQYDGDDRAE